MKKQQLSEITEYHAKKFAAMLVGFDDCNMSVHKSQNGDVTILCRYKYADIEVEISHGKVFAAMSGDYAVSLNMSAIIWLSNIYNI